MATSTVVRNGDGTATHIRETSDDGKTSTLYEYDGSLVAGITGDHRGTPVEVSESEGGETTAYEYDNSLLSSFWGHRGDRK
jgi:hypothetical protein